MVDNVSRKVRHEIMRTIHSKGTKVEIAFFKKLSNEGFRFRRHVDDLPGKPDLAIKKHKIVVFIDSCFWHGCRFHCRMPNSNIAYWRAKIKRNKSRDKEVNRYYRTEKWTLIRFWEHEINSLERRIKFIRRSIANSKSLKVKSKER